MSNKVKHIIVKLSKEGIYYNPQDYVSWPNTNFPAKSAFLLRGRFDIFWKVNLLSYSSENYELKLKVVDFDFGKSTEFENQEAKKLLKKMHFSPMDWQELQACFSYFESAEFDHLKATRFDEPVKNLKEKVKIISKKGMRRFSFDDEIIEVNFKYPILKLEFKLGYVELKKHIKELDEHITFKIKNQFLIPEFNFIKPYFSKVLGTRNIRVKGKIEKSKDANNITCHSSEIKAINDQVIATVQRLSMEQKIKKPIITAVDKSVFTADEYFDDYEISKGNKIRKSDQELLAEILDIKGVRNKKQLLYLSGKLQSTDTKIKFTLSPDFGFLFFVKGIECNHFIWELLNTNATYLWSLPKSIPSRKAFQMVELQINLIRDHGRMKYLQIEKEDALIFSKIIHKNANSALIDAFPLWRTRLNEKLI